MRLGWASRQIGWLTLLSVLVVLVAGLMELADRTRSTLERASVESRLVTGGLRRQIAFLLMEQGSGALNNLQSNPRVTLELEDAQVLASGVVHVAVTDPRDIVVAHTLDSFLTEPVERHEPLPEPQNLVASLQTLYRLWKDEPTYEVFTPLVVADEPVASIQVVVSGTFLLDQVRTRLGAGLLLAAAFVALATATGAVLSHIVVTRVRRARDAVVAVREGRRPKLADDGVGEFGELARELNLLGEQYDQDRRRAGVETTFRRAADLFGDGILTLGPSREIVMINVPAASQLELDREAVLGRKLDDVLPGHPLLAAVLELERAYDGSGETPSLTVQLPGEDDEEEQVAVAHVVENPDGVAGFLVEIKPAAEQAHLHTLVDQSHVLTWLAQMAAGVAHEIRNPLQSIQFELHALGLLQGDDPKTQKHLTGLQSKIGRLDDVVNGFLRLARLRPAAMQPTELNSLVDEVESNLRFEARQAGVELRTELETHLPDIPADRHLLRQALDNLVRNAIEATPSDDDTIRIRSRSDARWVHLEVADSGPGIPETNRSRVFDIYFTTKATGSGVGLALVRQVAAFHGGEVTIGAGTEAGLGATVTMSLPRGLEDSDEGER